MRTRTGVALALVAFMAAGCSSATQTPVAATVTATVTEDAHSRAIALVQAAYAGTTSDQAEEMMRNACTLIGTDPTPSGVLATRASLVSKGAGTMIEVTTLLSAAVAGECPEHLDALKGI